MRNRRRVAGVGAIRSLCAFALVIACLSRDEDRVVTLREVMSSPTIVGHRVRVVGRCSPSSLRIPEPPARSQDAWQLEADGAAMLVVGAQPRACVIREPTLLMLTVVVAEDTLAAIGDLPGAPRRYLVLVRGD